MTRATLATSSWPSRCSGFALFFFSTGWRCDASTTRDAWRAAARADGAGWLILNVNKRNASAIAFYERCGLAVREAVVVDIGEGFVMDDYVMAKPLAGGG